MIKTVYYIEQEDGLKALTISELHSLIEDKVIFGNTWVFDSTDEDWVPLNQLKIFQKFQLSFHYSEKSPDKPSINPLETAKDFTENKDMSQLEQGFFQDYVSLFQKQFDHLLEKNLNLVNENIQLKINMNEVKSENEIFRIETKAVQDKLEKEKYLVELKLNDAKEYVDDLMEETRILREGTSKISKDSNSKLERYVQEIKLLEKTLETKERELSSSQDEAEAAYQNSLQLRKYIDKYEEEIIEKIDEVKISHEKEIRELLSKIEELTHGQDQKVNEVIQKKNETINKLFAQNEQIKTKFKEESVVVKKTFENFKKTIEAEQSKNKELSVVLAEEKRKAKQLEKMLAEQDALEKSVPVAVKSKGITHRKQKQVGKLYEINNEAIWEIKGEPKDKCYTFLEVKNLILKKDINEKTFIRKKSHWWKKLKEYTEFKIEYFVKEVDGLKKVYIERASMRVPVNLSMVFNTLSADFTGKCLNISEGGCFLEVQNFSLYELKVNEEINLIITDDSLKIELKAQITDVSAEEKGLGVKFVDITSEQKTKIKDFVNSFLDQIDEAA